MSTGMRAGEMLFYGASGHAKVVIDSWLLAGGSVAGVFDDDETKKEILSFALSGKYDPTRHKEIPLVISIGLNSVRRKISLLVQHQFGNVIHPKAILSEFIALGEGIVVMGGAVINADVSIANHVIVNTGAVVDHDCNLGDFVHVAPGATLCGGVTVGEGTLIGAGATVLPGRKIGKWVTVGAGAVVTKDIPDQLRVAGNPARELLK